MKHFYLFIISLITLSATGQDMYSTKKGKISFYSKAPLENIEAHNNEATSFIDAKKGDVAFSVLIKGFKFEKSLMEEHFNTSYMESDKYPKSTFTGKIKDVEAVKWGVDGTYPVTVDGTLNIHNVSKPLTTGATITIKGGNVSGNVKFNIRVADYGIKIPSVVAQNIAEVVEITVDSTYSPVQNK